MHAAVDDIIVVKNDGGARNVVSGPEPFTCENGAWYTLKVIATGDSFRFFVDGVEITGLAFTDTTSPFQNGKVGVYVWDGTHAHFDDVIVTENFDVTTIGVETVKLWHMFSDDFESYAGTDASPTWTVVDETWIIEDENGNKVYSGSDPTGPAGFAISSLTLSTGTTIIETDFVEQGDSPWQNGLILFDYNGPDDFKAAGAAVGADEWRIQHYDGSWHIDAILSETIDTLTPYHLKVVIEDSIVTLYADDVKKLDYTFGSIGAGKIGLFSVNAHAHFDNVVVLSHIANALEPTLISDYDNDMVPDLEVKFDRAIVTEYLRDNGILSGEVELAVTGKANGADFAGSDSVRVIARGKLRV